MKSSELIRILQENPDLEVMVLPKGVCDEHSNIGTVTKVRVGEYIIYDDDSAIVKDDDSDHLCLLMYNRGKPDIYCNMSEEQLKQECNSLPWKKVVLVYVEAAYE